MKFSLLRSTPFIKAAKKIVRKNPLITGKLQKTLEMPSIDPL